METKLMNNYFNNQLIIAAIYLALIWNLFLSMCAYVCASLCMNTSFIYNHNFTGKWNMKMTTRLIDTENSIIWSSI